MTSFLLNHMALKECYILQSISMKLTKFGQKITLQKLMWQVMWQVLAVSLLSNHKTLRRLYNSIPSRTLIIEYVQQEGIKPLICLNHIWGVLMPLPLLDQVTFKNSIRSAYGLHCVKHFRNRTYVWFVHSRLRTKCGNMQVSATSLYIPTFNP